MISYIYDAKTNIMKIVLSLSVLILLLSCGKYERPFITFKSPEKRLMGTTWRCVKAIDAEGLEFEVFDHISFAIDGTDSTFTRISNHAPLILSSNISENDTIQGKWTWEYALGGEFNKQIIRQSYLGEGKLIRIISLSSKVFVYEDYSNNNTVYHYAPL